GHEQTEDEPTATLTATAAPPTSDAEIDAELLDIFIEEAHCVLDAIHEGLSTLVPSDSQTSLVDIRRGFHTLKGSGRMVGLSDFGEAAWEVEQTLNRWLQLEHPVTAPLHALLSDAHRVFTTWVEQIESGGSHALDFSALAAEAERLRGDSDADTPAIASAAALPLSEDDQEPAAGFDEVPDDALTGQESIAESAAEDEPELAIEELT